MPKKKLEKSPAYQFYPDKWDCHTAHLSDYAYRIYHRLLNWMWLHSDDKCSIKADPSAVAVVLAQPIDKISGAMNEIQNEHMPLLKLVRGKWISNGLKKEAKKQNDRRKKAQKSANKRWNKDLQVEKSHKIRDANALFEHSFPSPSPIPSSNKYNITELIDIFIQECPSLPKPNQKPSPSRQSRILARFKDLDSSLEQWRKFCQTIQKSDFLSGRSGTFRAGIDWVTKPENFTKIQEGNYANRTAGEPAKKQVHECWLDSLKIVCSFNPQYDESGLKLQEWIEGGYERLPGWLQDEVKEVAFEHFKIKI